MTSRWLTMALLFLGILVSYIDRGNLSIAASPMMREFAFSPERMGILLSSFFWSYSLAQIPAGYIVDRYGIKHGYFIGLAAWSLASAAIGFATSFWQIIALRIVLGAGEAIAPVASIAYIKRNFAESEQGLPTGVYMGGALLGPAIGAMAGGALIDPIGWRMLFTGTGLLGCLWLIPWWLWAPNQAPVSTAKAEAGTVPWLRAAGTPVFWAITLGAFFYSYYWYFILTWVPAYLVNERGFTNLRMGATVGLPLAGTAVTSLIAGALADRLIKRRGNALAIRKAFVACGFVFAAAIALINAIPSSNAILPVFLLSMCGVGLGVSNFWALTQLAAPARLIGRVLGYQNTVAQLAGITAPIATGLIVGADKHFALAILAAGLSPLIAAGSILLLLRRRHIERFQDILR